MGILSDYPGGSDKITKVLIWVSRVIRVSNRRHDNGSQKLK